MFAAVPYDKPQINNGTVLRINCHLWCYYCIQKMLAIPTLLPLKHCSLVVIMDIWPSGSWSRAHWIMCVETNSHQNHQNPAPHRTFELLCLPSIRQGDKSLALRRTYLSPISFEFWGRLPVLGSRSRIMAFKALTCKQQLLICDRFAKELEGCWSLHPGFQ